MFVSNPFQRGGALICFIAVWLLVGNAAFTTELKCQFWPEADALFHRDPKWLGGDGAYSIDLGEDRVLWMFGDSFIATGDSTSRRDAVLVRNSVGIQQGYDPTTATLKTYCRETAGKPSDFFEHPGDRWFWPGDGEIVGDTLLIFLIEVRKSDHWLGFRPIGSTAVKIENFRQQPDKWRLERVELTPNRFDVLVGSGTVTQDERFLYAFSSFNRTPNSIFLLRWSLASVALGDLESPEWWDASKQLWIDQAQLENSPPPLFPEGQTEFTVHYEPRLKSFLQTQIDDFPWGGVAGRTSRSLTGPWSPLERICEIPLVAPPEAKPYGYAVKAHPEQTAPGLAVTYCTNSFDLKVLVNNTEIYYPRFVLLKSESDAQRTED